MQITKVTAWSRQELVGRLQSVSLRGRPDRLPYLRAFITFGTVPLDSLYVAQDYLLRDNLRAIDGLLDDLGSFGIDPANGGGFFTVEREDAPARDFMLPVVEWSAIDGKLVVCDGAHRVAALAKRTSLDKIPVILVRDVDPEMPYYAIPGDTSGVAHLPVMDEPPPSGVGGGRKNYRCEGYRELFRDLNSAFTNVTTKR